MLTVRRIVQPPSLDIEMRWCVFECDASLCRQEHYGLLVSFGEDRWVVLAMTTGPGQEDMVEEAVFDGMEIARQFVAAFGLSWEELERPGAVNEQAELTVFAPAVVIAEIGVQSAEELQRLRSLTGSKLWKMGEAMRLVNAYRLDVGGERNLGSGTAW